MHADRIPIKINSWFGFGQLLRHVSHVQTINQHISLTRYHEYVWLVWKHKWLVHQCEMISKTLHSASSLFHGVWMLVYLIAREYLNYSGGSRRGLEVGPPLVRKKLLKKLKVLRVLKVELLPPSKSKINVRTPLLKIPGSTPELHVCLFW